MTDPTATSRNFRILSLDGGGAKGFYSLGVLREVEGLVGSRLHNSFDLIFGTSTGAIIASLLALGHSVEEIQELYKNYVPEIMRRTNSPDRSQALARLAREVFGDRKFDAVKTGLGIVATKWDIERPMIFKSSITQAHGRVGTFVPGFGVSIADAVQASCSAYPFFERKIVDTANGDRVDLVDGGYCANNPTLYAIADAIQALQIPRERIRVLSVGCGVYPEPNHGIKMWFAKKYLLSVQLLQKTLEINVQSMDQLREVLFKDIPTVRISDTFEKPEMATDLFEHNLTKLNMLGQRGSESFAMREPAIKVLLAE
jgi:patatin-like phospholipase/acyl hydrolase